MLSKRKTVTELGEAFLTGSKSLVRKMDLEEPVKIDIVLYIIGTAGSADASLS